MAGGLADLRKTLHAQVDGAWAKPEMLDAKDALSKIAKDSGYKKCVKDLWKEGTVSKDALAECAEKAGISEAYAKEWGKA